MLPFSTLLKSHSEKGLWQTHSTTPAPAGHSACTCRIQPKVFSIYGCSKSKYAGHDSLTYALQYLRAGKTILSCMAAGI